MQILGHVSHNFATVSFVLAEQLYQPDYCKVFTVKDIGTTIPVQDYKMTYVINLSGLLEK